MKKLWRKLRERCTDDYEENNIIQLSRKDKFSLLYGVFMVCAFTIILVCVIFHIHAAKANEQAEKEMNTFLNTVTTYLASATEEEYMEIAAQIRDDLVLTKYSRNMEEYVSYIPNTAEACCAEREHYSAQAYLVCTNTGERYPLDQSEADHSLMCFSYDEISETSAQISHLPDESRTTVTFCQGRGIVSVHRMKGLFCDSCIDKILAAVDNHFMMEYVLFDPVTMAYYSISEGTQTIGSDTLTITCGSNGYEMEVAYGNGGTMDG